MRFRGLLCGLVFVGVGLVDRPTIATEAVGNLPNAPTINLSTGAATLRIPIPVPPGPGGLVPDLDLVYSSQGGDGIYGVGWSLLLGEVGCSARFGIPDYENCARFELDGGLLTGPDATNSYHTKIESFARIERVGSEENASWRVTQVDGRTHYYGRSADSRVAAASGTASWLLDEIRDAHGNAITFHYDEGDSGIRYASKIQYGNGTREIRFVYEGRPDRIHHYRGGVEQRITQRLREIQVLSNGGVYMRLALDYDATGYTTTRSRLTRLQQFGNDCTDLNVDPMVSCDGLPPVRLTYSDAGTVETKSVQDPSWSTPGSVQLAADPFDARARAKYNSFVDINGDGLPDIVHDSSGPANLPPTPGLYDPVFYLNSGNAGWSGLDDFGDITFLSPQLNVTQTGARGEPDPETMGYFGWPHMGICDTPVLTWHPEPLNMASADYGMARPSFSHSWEALATPDAQNSSFIRLHGNFIAQDLDGDGFADLVMSVRLTGIHKTLDDCENGNRLPNENTTWIDGATVRVVFRNPGESGGGWTMDVDNNLSDGNLADSLPLFGVIAAESPEYVSRRMFEAFGYFPYEPIMQPIDGPCMPWGLGGQRTELFLANGAQWGGDIRDFCVSQTELWPTFVDLNGDGYQDILVTVPENQDALFYAPTWTGERITDPVTGYPVAYDTSWPSWRHSETSVQAWTYNPDSDPSDPDDPRWVRATDYDLPLRHSAMVHAFGDNPNRVPGEIDLEGMHNGRLYDTAARLVDLNRDGLTDFVWTDWKNQPRPTEISFSVPRGVLLNRGSGDGSQFSAWCTSETLSEAPEIPVCNDAQEYLIPEELSFVHTNIPDGPEAQALESFPYWPEIAFSDVLFAVDANADGWVDLLQLHNSTDMNPGLRAFIQQPGANPRWVEDPSFVPDGYTGMCMSGYGILQGIGAKVIDADGNGGIDVIASRYGGCFGAVPSAMAQFGPSDRLIHYDNGRGGSATLSYTTDVVQRDGALEVLAAADAAAREPPPAAAGLIRWGGRPVVTSLETRGPNRAAATTHYQFARSRWSPEYKKSLGFRLARVTHPDGSQVDHFFYQQEGLAGRLAERVVWEAGRVRQRKEEVWELANPAIVTGAWDGGGDDSAAVWVARRVNLTSRNEYGITPGVVGEAFGAEYTETFVHDDAYGYNFVAEHVLERPTGTLITHRVPASDANYGIYGLVADLQITSAHGLLRHSRFSYQDSTGASTRGNMGKREDWEAPRSNPVNGVWRQVDYEYDSHGNLIRKTREGPTASRTTNFCYDGDSGCPLGHGSHSLLTGIQDPLGNWTKLYPHPVFEKYVKTTSDYVDEPTVEQDFDAFGRLTDTYIGNARVPTSHISYHDDFSTGSAPYVEIFEYPDETGTNYLWTAVYGDGFGGTWKTVSAVDGGRYSGSARFHDPENNSLRETYPVACESNGSPDATCSGVLASSEPVTLTLRDALGRPTRVETPDGFSVTQYGSTLLGGSRYDTVLHKNAKGDLTRRFGDGKRDVRIDECSNSLLPTDGDLSDDACLVPDTTEFVYAADGALTAIYDAMTQVYEDDPNHRLRYAYDTLGRVIQIDDPNAGSSFTRYDIAGNVHESEDARGFIRIHEYDVLDRLVEVSVAVPPGAAQEETVTLRYPAHQRQPESESTQTTYAQTYAYDTLGRLAGLHSGWPPWLVSTYRYDLLGRVVEIESPVEMDGLARTTRYEYEGASLKRVCELSGQTSCAEPGAQAYLEDVSYDALGRRTQLSLPGGDRTFAYDATTQRITRDDFSSTGSSGYWIQYRYENATGSPAYDEIGNILEIQGATSIPSAPAFSATYGYDARNRLTSWSREGATQALYEYDALGNLTQHAGVTQTYEGEDKPHAIRSRPGVSYDYDAAGNLKSRLGAGGNRYYHFDSAGRLACVGSSEGGCQVLEVTYDLSGKRIRERTGSTDRWFVGDEFVYEERGGSDSSARLEIFAFGERIAFQQVDGGVLREPQGFLPVPEPLWAWPFGMGLLGLLWLASGSGLGIAIRQRPGYAGVTGVLIVGLAVPPGALAQAGGGSAVALATFRWVISDAVGSGLVLLDEAGARIRHTVFDPFGAEADSVGAGGRHFYGGHPEQEETGLYFMKARWYDPAAGRFLSVDPIVDMRTPQAMNAYSYVANNPVNRTDPTGMYLDGPGEYGGDNPNGGTHTTVGGAQNAAPGGTSGAISIMSGPSGGVPMAAMPPPVTSNNSSQNGSSPTQTTLANNSFASTSDNGEADPGNGTGDGIDGIDFSSELGNALTNQAEGQVANALMGAGIGGGALGTGGELIKIGIRGLVAIVSSGRVIAVLALPGPIATVAGGVYLVGVGVENAIGFSNANFGTNVATLNSRLGFTAFPSVYRW